MAYVHVHETFKFLTVAILLLNNSRTYAIMSTILSFVQNARFYINFSLNLSYLLVGQV